MAFDFLGIFSKLDVENLKAYLQAQLDQVDAQINFMLIEQDKLQKTLVKLLDVCHQNGVKFKTFDKSFLRKVNSQTIDNDSAVLVQRLKEPYYSNIKVREDLEHRAKKLMDKIEQIQERIHLLRISKSEFRTGFESINALFDNVHGHLTVEKEVANNVI